MSQFAEVARQLGMPEAEPMLAHWSRHVGYRRKLNKFDDADTRKMISIASQLEDQLRIYSQIEKQFGIEVPEEVDSASQALSELIEYLQSELPRRKGGPDPDTRRRFCAAVCGYIWQRSHDKVQPYFPPLQAACEAYWLACGQVETSDVKGWDEYLEWARDYPTDFFAEHPLTPL
jgi:hypothetical protein